MTMHPLVKRLLDGELRFDELPGELRQEAEAFQRLFGTARATELHLRDDLDRRVMTEIRERATAPGVRRNRGGLSWLVDPWEVRMVLRPWMVGAALAAAATVVMVVRPHPAGPVVAGAPRPDSVFVRFELYAPGARTVGLAGSFNRWNAGTTPLVRVGGSELWTVTVPLPPGSAQYGFIVDGQRWVPDPAAPSVDDGFGRRNSVIAVPGEGRTL